ncbi:N-acetylmuramoyl-L-alanine amidase [Deinococcus sp. Marseille-Q6407]|uniref:N-acetylmuramoyl-L-alanine amidase family protein n=1 Tax=Deinococcus sp. Marseille-Q6407 TaxID=2969223 RepID=UPI0021BF0A4F|nr:N-acetylmuramoyl-L-alanine amidase [Deinococcus sp. Marseille-Q6407]
MKQHFLHIRRLWNAVFRRGHRRPAALLGLGLIALAAAMPAAAQSLPPAREIQTLDHPRAPIFVAYPDNGHRVSADHVLLEGSVLPGATLQLNGQPITLGPDGLFIEWVPLQPGTNLLRLTSHRGGQTWTGTLQVIRQMPAARPELPYHPLPSPRQAEVQASEAGVGLNTVQAAWENDAGQAALYGRSGQRVAVVGTRGDLSRVQLADGQLLWASSNTLRLLPPGTLPQTAVVGAPHWTAAGPGEWQEVSWLVSARTPFQLSETADGGLRLSLIGAQRVGEWPAGQQPSLQAAQQGAALTLDLALPRPLHGYQAFYRSAAGQPGGDFLVLRYRLAPLPGPLTGRRIVLDAGHGGSELGGAGALRVPEKDLTLPITLRAAELLRQRGATVVLTRGDDRTVPLYQRPLLAEQQNADVLVSIHANAIPDGRDPRSVRGIGSYFSHPQARPLAAALQAALVSALPEAGDDGLHPGADLALTRPTSQPSVLLELGYLTDPQNLQLLMSSAGQEAYAQAVAAGLTGYFAHLP